MFQVSAASPVPTESVRASASGAAAGFFAGLDGEGDFTASFPVVDFVSDAFFFAFFGRGLSSLPSSFAASK